MSQLIKQVLGTCKVGDVGLALIGRSFEQYTGVPFPYDRLSQECLVPCHVLSNFIIEISEYKHLIICLAKISSYSRQIQETWARAKLIFQFKKNSSWRSARRMRRNEK